MRQVIVIVVRGEEIVNKEFYQLSKYEKELRNEFNMTGKGTKRLIDEPSQNNYNTYYLEVRKSMTVERYEIIDISSEQLERINKLLDRIKVVSGSIRLYLKSFLMTAIPLNNLTLKELATIEDIKEFKETLEYKPTLPVDCSLESNNYIIQISTLESCYEVRFEDLFGDMLETVKGILAKTNYPSSIKSITINREFDSVEISSDMIDSYTILKLKELSEESKKQ